ncbi:MAG: exosortase system-associated protein, TIGR04073 family [Candidatus Omnitrophica bacterium]|nr:exosortase system-associated protein, TIGR04073 family [Candidatus Omnitrophota bacterium]
MFKGLTAIVIAIMLVSFATAAYASTDEFVEGMRNKLWRGAVNTLTGWVELPTQIIKGYSEGFMGDETGKVAGTVMGIFDGLCHFAGRTASGLVDLFGFWTANPVDNAGVGLPLDAEYAWEEGEPYDMFDPNLMDGGVKPIGKKLLRGAGNIFLGVAELPGQVIKGASEGAPDLGIIKGLWYWYSREVYGFSDIVTVLLPGTKDQVGMPFDEEYPWDALVDNM